MSSTTECSCPPGCVYCAKTGECTCPEHTAPYSNLEDRPENPTAKFKRYCEENEGAVECRIYED